MRPEPRETVTIITGKASMEFYHGLQIEGEKIGVHSLSHVDDFVGHGNPDLVLLDCCDYTKDGLQLLSSIKSTKRGVPVFFLTDMSSEETAIEAFRKGAREYFKKPVDPTHLKKRIEKMLSLKRAGRKPRNITKQVGESRLDHRHRPTKATPPEIRRAVKFIQENFSDEFSLSRLAREATLSKFHFSRVFKKHLGISPMAYVTQIRIEKAKELLRHGDLNVSQVAKEVGFHDLGNFVRHFKRFVQMTPKSFRRTESVK